MTDVAPASSAEAAQWLLASGVDWWDLVRYGPPGFDVYVRIAFDPDPGGPDPDGDDAGLRLTLGALASRTTTPTTGYAAIWEGWTTGPPPQAPRVPIPGRTMLLFTGPVTILRDAPGLAWRCRGQTYQAPHLVWPEDRAGCGPTGRLRG